MSANSPRSAVSLPAQLKSLSPITTDLSKDHAIVLLQNGKSDSASATPVVKSNPNALVMLPLTPYPEHLLTAHPREYREDPDTPSSTIVEFGDHVKLGQVVPSAAELASTVYHRIAQSQSIPTPVQRPESRGPKSIEKEGTRGRSSSNSNSRTSSPVVGPSSTPVQRESSQSSLLRAAQAGSTREREKEREKDRDRSDAVSVANSDKPLTALERELANHRVNRFLQSIAAQSPVDPDKELLMENRGLYQRVAALQRTERELLADNQDLMRQYATLKQHHDVRRRQWREDFRLREKTFEARIRQLKDQIQRQDEQLAQLTASYARRPPPLVSDEEVSVWFDRRDSDWHSWAQEFSNPSIERLTTELHPTQLQELCEGVKGFVRLTEDGNLPAELLSHGSETIPSLLHGMLANFICAETLASPFWVFNALAAGTLESPSIPAPPPALSVVTGSRFRMDRTLFNDIAPLRSAACAHTPGSPLFPPPLITSMLPSLGATGMGMPIKTDMESLYTMLSKAQTDDCDASVHTWRSQLMRLFAEGGMSTKDPQSAGSNESRRVLIESRLNFARKLKEKFLGGAARYLLKEQTFADGIEALESSLMSHIDSALRFSCQLWSRATPLRIHGFNELSGSVFRERSPIMELCLAQAPTQYERLGPETPPPGYYDGRAVLMVVQPGVEAIGVGDEAPEDPIGHEDGPKIWLKARVMVSNQNNNTVGPGSSPLSMAALAAFDEEFMEPMTAVMEKAPPVKFPLRVVPTANSKAVSFASSPQEVAAVADLKAKLPKATAAMTAAAAAANGDVKVKIPTPPPKSNEKSVLSTMAYSGSPPSHGLPELPKISLSAVMAANTKTVIHSAPPHYNPTHVS